MSKIQHFKDHSKRLKEENWGSVFGSAGADHTVTYVLLWLVELEERIAILERTKPIDEGLKEMGQHLATQFAAILVDTAYAKKDDK